MKLISGKPYIEFSELGKVGMSKCYLKVAHHRASASWNFIDDPDDRRRVLVDYSTMKPAYQEKVKSHFGCPYQYLAAQILKPLLHDNPSDINFLSKYRLPNGNAFATATLAEYVTACRWLHFLSQINIRKIKATGYASAADFYKAVITLLRTDNVRLPHNYAKLLRKVAAYKKQGAIVVIHAGSGKASNNLKVADAFCESLLLELISHYNQFEDPFVADKYNEQVTAKGYKPIKAATVGYYRRERDMLIASGREGSAAWRDKYDKIVHRSGPTAPLLLINSDDLDLDEYFQEAFIDKDGHRRTNYHFRFKLMVVMDMYLRYPLGYAIGVAQSKELVYAAYADAINHICELTGNYFIWQQIVTDHWGISALEEWYKAQAVYTPAKVGNARSKPIEAAFGKWHKVLKQYPNWAGHNITAKTKANYEAIRANYKNLPHKEHGHHQVHDIINRIRQQVNDNGVTLQQQWLAAFNENKQRMMPLDDTRRLHLFGTRHKWQNELTNGGIRITINGTEYIYDVPEVDYMRNVGKKMQVIYDPYNMSKILATADDGRVQIICPMYEPMKMAIADMTAGDRALINVRLDEKKRISQYVLDAKAERQNTLAQHGINAASILQAGYVNKELNQAADNAYRRKMIEGKDAFDYDNENENNTPPQAQEGDVWDM